MIPKHLRNVIDSVRDPGVRDALEQIARKLVSDGLTVAAGWQVYQAAVLPRDASSTQRLEARRAFYAGACHVWLAGVHGPLDRMADGDAGAPPSDEDVELLRQIDRELHRFLDENSH